MDKNKTLIVGIIVIVVIVIAAALLLGNNVQRADNELVVAAGTHTHGEPEMGYDPAYGWGFETEPLIQSTILKRDGDLNYYNDLADNYTISDDMQTYTVELKPGIKFTDNTTLTAEDVVFSYNNVKEIGVSDVDLSNMANVTALNDTTVVFELNTPDSTFISKLADVGIVPSDSYNNETYGSNPVGSGPFKFVQWDKGQQVILEKNPDYYGDQPEFDKLTILYLQNDGALAAAQKGEVDIAEIPVNMANETIEGMSLKVLPSMDVRGISLPNVPNVGKTTEDGAAIGNNVTSDLAIRQALNYGINRTEIINGPLYGYGEINDDGIANTLPWADNETLEGGDIEKAKQILEEGGWKDTDGDGIVEKDGLKASFELDYKSDDQPRQALSVAVAEKAKEIGIEITPEGKTWDEMDLTKNSNAIIWGFGTADPSFLYHEYYSDLAGEGYDNPSMINNSALDAAIESAMQSELNSSYSQWSQVGNYIGPAEDASWLWIGQVEYTYYVDDTLNISEDTATIQPHGGDIFGNIFDWTRVGSIEN